MNFVSMLHLIHYVCGGCQIFWCMEILELGFGAHDNKGEKLNMDIHESHSWTLGCLIGAFIFFVLAYFLLCGDYLTIYLWQFEEKANEVVANLPWVKNVKVTMSAQPARPLFAEQLQAGLQTTSNIVAVSSCKVDLFGRFFLHHILEVLENQL
ncbi:hypothetical protein PIB30_003707 [Stylosanthes scabra]|uniref:ATP synthase F0 subunit 8 n=1 Tax=Stylosanthes scabra TaxID=79078 RepID=A0ABU6Q398_9FABA|nr:hypothetical protein [Stylosanthes scabra]